MSIHIRMEQADRGLRVCVACLGTRRLKSWLSGENLPCTCQVDTPCDPSTLEK